MSIETFLPITTVPTESVIYEDNTRFSWSERVTDACVIIGVVYTLAKVLFSASSSLYKDRDTGSGILVVVLSILIAVILSRPIRWICSPVSPTHSIQDIINSHTAQINQLETYITELRRSKQ